MANYPERKQEGRRQESESGTLAEGMIQAMIERGVITLLCGVGLYTSLFMLRKGQRAERGKVKGPSVVKTERAHLFGVPNSLLGTLFYLCVAVAIWFARPGPLLLAILAATLFAAGTSAYLAYSLLFVTRRECPYCWTAHGVNWALLALVGWLFARPS